MVPGLKGVWIRAGVPYWDDLMAVVISNFPHTSEDKRWLIEYAGEVLCKRFRQEAILVGFIPLVEVHIVEARKGGD